MEHAFDHICKATTPNELRKVIVEELHLRAWQERASARIGRTNKRTIAEHEHSAFALECLAASLTSAEIANQQPTGIEVRA